MLLCNTCKQPVYVDLSKCYMIMGTISLTAKGLQTKTGDIIKRGDMEAPQTFYCSTCDKEVKVEDLLSYCYHCREYFPINDLALVNGLGILVCDNCKDSFMGNSFTSVKTILKKNYQF